MKAVGIIPTLYAIKEKERNCFKMERDENGLSVLFPRSGGCNDRNTNGSTTNGGDMTNRGGIQNGCSMQNGCGMTQLAMVYSPMQCFRMLYSPEKALMRGTMFEELDKPLEEDW